MHRVLLVEDDLDLAASIMRWLQGDDVEAAHAADLAEAARLLHEHQPDLIISDNQLPDGLGVEWLPGVKAAHPHIVCVLQSGAYSDREAERIASDTGLDGVHAKGLRALRALGAHMDALREGTNG